MTDPDDDLAGAERQLRERLDANLAAADKALKQAMSTPTVKGSTGQAKANALFEAAASCDELAVKLCRELLEVRAARAAEERTRRADAILAPFAEVDAA